MSLTYPQTISVERPPSTDGLGRPSGTATPVYDGTADVQEGQVARRTAGGDAYKVGDAVAFLPVSDHGIETSDAVRITWADGTTQSAIVAETRRLDDSLVLTYES